MAEQEVERKASSQVPKPAMNEGDPVEGVRGCQKCRGGGESGQMNSQHSKEGCFRQEGGQRAV